MNKKEIKQSVKKVHRYVCDNCGKVLSIKKANAYLNVGFGVRHLACPNCGQNAIVDHTPEWER